MKPEMVVLSERNCLTLEKLVMNLRWVGCMWGRVWDVVFIGGCSLLFCE